MQPLVLLAEVAGLSVAICLLHALRPRLGLAGIITDPHPPWLGEPLDDIALAAAVMGSIDGQAERLHAGPDGLLDMILDEAPAAPNIKLEQCRAGGGGADLGLGPLRDRADHDRNPECASGLGDWDDAVGVKGFEPANRREQDRQAR